MFQQSRERIVTAGFVLIAAFAIRSGQFGNPMIDVDENFYLFIADRMLHGALPYVDIWDRKPLGLFLIYAGARLLGGDGVIQYQVVATLFAAGTAFIVTRIAARATTPIAAALAGLLYLFLLGVAGGMGGQAPVFYNLFIAGAALSLVDVFSEPGVSSRRLRTRGALAMALVGLALQVKYSAIFEGAFFGAMLLYRRWGISRRLDQVAKDAALWASLAFAPTCAAMLTYAWLGHLPEFVHANFLSIFARSPEPGWLLLKRLGNACLVLGVPVALSLLATIYGAWRQSRASRAAYRFVLAWLAAAFSGYVAFGSYFNHYALPLMAPLAVAGAPFFACRAYHAGRIATVLLLTAGPYAYGRMVTSNLAKRGGAAGLTAVEMAIRPRLTGCLYLYDGDTMLYHRLHSCLLTRYPFPTHLNLKREARSIGIDPLQEIRRIFSLRPTVVVDTEQGNEQTERPAANALARGILRRDYMVVARYRLTRDNVVVYALRPVPPTAHR